MEGFNIRPERTSEQVPGRNRVPVRFAPVDLPEDTPPVIRLRPATVNGIPIFVNQAMELQKVSKLYAANDRESTMPSFLFAREDNAITDTPRPSDTAKKRVRESTIQSSQFNRVDNTMHDSQTVPDTSKKKKKSKSTNAECAC